MLTMLAGGRSPRRRARRKAPPPRPAWSDGALASVERVLTSCAARYGVPPSAARTSNVPSAVRARYEWVRLVHDTWDLSSVETGTLCRVNHTTVLRALRMHREDRT